MQSDGLNGLASMGLGPQARQPGMKRRRQLRSQAVSVTALSQEICFTQPNPLSHCQDQPKGLIVPQFPKSDRGQHTKPQPGSGWTVSGRAALSQRYGKPPFKKGKTSVEFGGNTDSYRTDVENAGLRGQRLR